MTLDESLSKESLKKEDSSGCTAVSVIIKGNKIYCVSLNTCKIQLYDTLMFDQSMILNQGLNTLCFIQRLIVRCCELKNQPNGVWVKHVAVEAGGRAFDSRVDEHGYGVSNGLSPQ